MKDLGGLEMKNEILQTGKVLKVGYCGLQNLLAYESPVAFIKSRTYGWSSDIYELSSGVYISTGYRPIGREVFNPYELKGWEKRAAKIQGLPWRVREQKARKLLEQFAEEAARRL